MSDTPVGVAPAAQGRLADSASGKCFTSDLSVNEFLLVQEAGFDPLGMVLGTSMYHIGIQVARWGQSQELTVLSQAMYSARELAMARMVAEAEALQADGIVGVRLDMQMYVGGQEMMEFLAAGTAVRWRQDPGRFRAPSGRPFTSDLSGQDLFTVIRTGHFPVAFVLGTCVYHVAHQSALQSLRQIGRNVEMPLYTQAIYEARELAMARMQHEAEAAQATGVVGVQLTTANHVWGEHAVEFLALGTAVRSFERVESAAPGFVLPLAP
ncbi:MAG TPA: heavy metal-binding domain-containing protein [Acidimicrobiales bacterium]|nr:heavy metal-binding domain-containing protein [Acidimicrobiales bacterium]